MIIEGPVRISTETSEDGAGFSLRLMFVEEFQQLDTAVQASQFAAYLEALRSQSSALDETDPNRQGMLIVLQVGEQLLPLIQEGSLPLNEELEIEIDQAPPLASFLANASSQIN